MAITNESLKSMKAKQLRDIIREAIDEVLSEDVEKSKAFRLKANQLRKQAIDLTKQATAEEEKDLKQDIQAAANEGLDEMANVGKLFQLSPDTDVSTLTGQKSRIAIAMQDAGPVSQANVAKDLGYTKTTTKGEIVGHQNPIDKNFREMIAAGIIVPAGTQIAQRFSRPTPEPGEEGDEEVGQKSTEPEDLFMGSAENPLSMYFDKVPNASGEEEFNDEEEPTAGDIEPGEPAPTGGMSDEDYEAFMKYDDLKNRLDATKSNILKAKRSKGSTAGDIGDKPGTELARLNDLKKSLETRIDAIVSKSPYLQKRIEKLTGKAYEPIEVEPEEDDTIDEAFNAEYEKRKLQFYAGIIK